jgi:hypothetical protein
MFALWGKLGYAGDENRAIRLDVTTRILGLPQILGSSSDLTSEQADRLIAALDQRLAEMPAATDAPQDGES